MMQYTLEGKFKNRPAVEIYVDNLCKSLKLDRRRASELNIKFMTRLPQNVLGLASGGPRWGEVEIAKTSEGKKVTFMNQMLALAHEMIHIKQYMKGEMLDDSKAVWKGKNHDKTPYTKQPWEIEAHKQEHKLFAKNFPFELPFSN